MTHLWKSRTAFLPALLLAMSGALALAQPALAGPFDDNDFIVAGEDNDKVAVYDENFVFKSYLNQGFDNPAGLDMLKNGNVVSITLSDHLQEHKPNGDAGTHIQNAEFGQGLDIKEDRTTGLRYVATQDATRGIAEFNAAGVLQRNLGSKVYWGVAVLPGGVLWANYGDFIDTYSLATGAATGSIPLDHGQIYTLGLFYSAATNTVFVTDFGSNAIYERTTSGAFVRKFQLPQQDNDGYSYSVTRGPNGNVYASEAVSNTVFEWQPDGTYIGSFYIGDRIDWPIGMVWTGIINQTNQAPDAQDDLATVAEDSGATSIDVLANDTDFDGNILNVQSAGAATHGTVTLTGPAGAYTGVSYTPNANYHGPDSFTYTIRDNHGGFDTATVNVTVTAVNDPPVASAGPDQTVTQNNAATPVALNGGASSDVDGDALTFTWRENGNVIANGSNPVVNLVPGAHTIVLTVSDGIDTATDTVFINVVPPASTFKAKVNGWGNFSMPGGRYAYNLNVANQNGLKGSLQYVSKTSGEKFSSTQITAVVVTGNSARVFGKGTLGGGTTFDFVIDVADNYPTFSDKGDPVTISVSNSAGFGSTVSGVVNPGDVTISSG